MTCWPQTRARAQRMLRHGTTTAEAKTGYGLETAAELRQLEVLLRLDAEGPLETGPHLPGRACHPAEFHDDPQGYTDLVCREMLPAVRAWWQATLPRPPAAFRGCLLRDRRLQPGAVARNPATARANWASRSKSTPTSSTTWAGPAWQPSWGRSPPTTW